MKTNQKVPLIVGGVALFFFVFTCFVYWYKAQKVNVMVIADDIVHLAEIFDAIHRDCKIINFEHQKNNIDFLNVISFEGSEVGPMNLTYPDKWKGAYIKDNPTIQEKYYQVVETKKGYYIVPGPGVRLSNGKIIGKDIIFSQDTDIDVLIATHLNYNGRPLAMRIMTGSELPKNVNSFREKMTRDRLRGM